MQQAVRATQVVCPDRQLASAEPESWLALRRKAPEQQVGRVAPCLSIGMKCCLVLFFPLPCSLPHLLPSTLKAGVVGWLCKQGVLARHCPQLVRTTTKLACQTLPSTPPESRNMLPQAVALFAGLQLFTCQRLRHLQQHSTAWCLQADRLPRGVLNPHSRHLSLTLFARCCKTSWCRFSATC